MSYLFEDRPTGVDRGTGKLTVKSRRARGNYLIFFWRRRFHLRGITGFYLISVHMISRGLVIRISVLALIFLKTAPQVQTGGQVN